MYIYTYALIYNNILYCDGKLLQVKNEKVHGLSRVTLSKTRVPNPPPKKMV